MKVTVQVTRDDIRRGQPEKCQYCPIAHALRRVIKPECGFLVTEFWVAIYPTIHTSGPSYDARLPLFAHLFVKSFDNCEQVEPITFDLDIPEEYLKVAA
jgi:hypothetical protein